eukprot:292791-Chlamydomonas_euryale.AAC.2
MHLLNCSPIHPDLVHEQTCAVHCTNRPALCTAPTSAQETTAGVAREVLAPITKRHMGTRFWDLVPHEHRGVPDYFVAHTHSGNFFDTISQLMAQLAPGLEDGDEQGDEEAGPGEDDLFVWMDVFALPQGVAGTPEFDVAEVKEAVVTCSAGLVLVLDPGLDVLNRTWCMTEVWMSAYYGDPNSIILAFPEDLSVAVYAKFECMCLKLDMSLTTTAQPRDKPVRSCARPAHTNDHRLMTFSSIATNRYIISPTYSPEHPGVRLCCTRVYMGTLELPDARTGRPLTQMPQS